MNSQKKHVLVLASGGIDSTACIMFYKKMKFKVQALYIDYGQISSKNEIKSIRAVSKYFKINLRIIKIKNDLKWSKGLVQGRNAVLYLTGLMNFKEFNGMIASGIHAGTPYYDCSKNFMHDIQRLFDGYSNGTIKAVAPFLTFSKKEIIEFCKNEKIPLELTYSCEHGRKQPCGNCDTCKDIVEIYASSK
jgi:7-cyano-7-deazaguanine synthase